MNERIKELWNLSRNPSGRGHDEEKFALLIVGECIGVCAAIAAVRAGYNDVDGRDTADSCVDAIKEYFGVEQ